MALITKPIICTASMAILAGCGGSSTGVVSMAAPASATSGYATSTSSIDDPSDTIFVSGPIFRFTNSGVASLVEISGETSATGMGDQYSVEYDDETIVVTFDAAQNAYLGSSGATSLRIRPMFISSKEQLITSWLNYNDATKSDFSGVIYGFTTDPDDVAGQSGLATYHGSGIIATQTVTGNNYATGSGNVTLEVDFDNGTLDGTFDVTENVAFRFGTASIGDTTINFDEVSITENAFVLTGNLDATAFDLTAAEQFDGDAAFYETDATAAAGHFTATGVRASDGLDILIKGTIGADR